MSISKLDPWHPQQQLYRAWEQALESAAVTKVVVRESELHFVLADGRRLTVPMSWFPRLVHATPEERANLQIVGHGTIVEWPDLDEGVEIVHLLVGFQEGESERSFKRWLEERERGKKG